MSETVVPNLRFVRAERDEHILSITIDRPEVLNALHPPAHDELAHIFNQYAADDTLRVAVITGSGERSFCVGNDLKYRSASAEDEFPLTGFAGITKRFDLWKPVLAAVNGLCLGGGLEIVLACDIAIASATAEFGLPEPLVGHAAIGGGGLHRLARQVRMKDAMWLALRAQRVTAPEALRLGLINEVVPATDLQSRARAVASEIMACAPLAIQATKQVLLSSQEQRELAASLAEQYPAADRMTKSEDAREGLDAFVAKRKPRWGAR